MTQNYFKGQITVVFPATTTSPLYGKILPVWGSKTNKGDQINFNVYALKENKKFPEEGGACEIDYKDTIKWTKKQNGNVEYYTPNVPFIVYFKIKTTPQRDGSQRLVAVSIYTPDKLNLSDRLIADGITRQPSSKELRGETKISAMEALEMSLSVNAATTSSKKAKKVAKKQLVEELNIDDLEDEGALLEAVNQEEWGHQHFQNRYAPVDNLSRDEDEEYVEEELEGKEDDTLEDEDYDKYYGSKKTQKKFKGDY